MGPTPSGGRFGPGGPQKEIEWVLGLPLRVTFRGQREEQEGGQTSQSARPHGLKEHVGARMLVLRCVFSLRTGQAPFPRGGPGCHCGVSRRCSQSFASPLQGELEGPAC